MKYIIEIEDVPFSKVRINDNGAQNLNLYRVKGFNALVFDDEGLNKLTPLDKKLEDAYQKGFEAGQHEATTLEYQQGLNDAWETITKIAKMPDGERGKIFGETWISNILNGNSLAEITEKLKTHEQQKADEIKVGDEVTPKSNDSNWMGVVVGFDDTDAIVMSRGGYTAIYQPETLKKTNKNFPQVAKLLKAIKGEQRDCHTCKHHVTSSIECVDCRGFGKWEPKEGE